MIWVKIALQNVLKHRLSTAVLIVIFAAAAFVLFWSCGFCNFVISLINDINRDSYGDITFITDYVETDKVKDLLRFPEIEKVVCEREISALFDNPENSTMSVMVELTPENRKRLLKYICPIEGRLPEKPDEIMITDFKQKGVYKIGDMMFATVTTPDKIINAMQYKVVGIAKSTGAKAIGYGFMVSRESMDMLLNSSDQVNLVYLFLKKEFRTEWSIRNLHTNIANNFSAHHIQVKNTWTIIEQKVKMSIFSQTMNGIKIIVLCIMFPLIGTVIAAAVWIYSFKRRKEIWTYISLGMKDSTITLTYTLEYWIVTAIGIVLGGSLGYVSSYVAKAANVWLTFSYSVTSQLYAQFGIVDALFMSIFFLVTVFIWIQIPLRRIFKAVPFSY